MSNSEVKGSKLKETIGKKNNFRDIHKLGKFEIK